MKFFLSGYFWFFEGIILCVVSAGFHEWMKGRGISMPLWKWILFISWVMLFGFTIAFIGTCIGENEMVAGIKGGFLFGFIVLIYGAGVWSVINRKNK